MKRTLAVVVALAGLCAGLVWAQGSGMQLVTSRFVGGNLVFYDKDGAEIFTIDGVNRKMSFPTAGTLAPAAGEIVNADVNASAAIARSKLATDTAAIARVIPISSLLKTTGVPITTTSAGEFNLSISSNVLKAQGESTDNTTKADSTNFQFGLPDNYVSGGTITVRVRCALISTGSPTNNGSTVDVQVYKQADGAVGSDLSTTTSAATFAALDTWYTKDFVITPTSLVAGDILNVVIATSVVDSEAGAGTIRFNMDPPRVLLDVQG